MTAPKQRVIGSSELWHQVLQQASQVAPLNRPVLLVGERGTGKELIAERLHYLSLRWQQPYLQVNCAAMTENLLESNCLAMRLAPSQEQRAVAQGFLSAPMVAPCF
jgi:Transcriptional regulator containing PAS, AAA-type ATPase, and DNA-binding domains